MSNESIIVFFGFLATIIAVMTPIIKLNTSITKLNTTLESFQRQTETNHEKLAERVTAHGKEIDTIKEMVIKNRQAVEFYHKEK